MPQILDYHWIALVSPGWKVEMGPTRISSKSIALILVSTLGLSMMGVIAFSSEELWSFQPTPIQSIPSSWEEFMSSLP
ncbi:unnamed protein product [Lupinus luteus]|uniref:Uncharacterized protein n=1 Tax=Lupinus luteus TaxID=3873 RepID=A0AAV1WVH0_LUPLU